MRMNEVEVFRFYRLFVRIDSVFHPNLLQCPTSSVSFGVNTPSDAHLGDVARRCQKCIHKATRLSPNCPSHNILQLFFGKFWENERKIRTALGSVPL